MSKRSDPDYLQPLYDSLSEDARKEISKPIDDAYKFFEAHVNDLPSVIELIVNLVSTFEEIGSKRTSHSSDPRVAYLRENYEKIVSGDLKFKAMGKEFTYSDLLTLIHSVV